MGTKDEQIAALEETIKGLRLEIKELESAAKVVYDDGYDAGHMDGWDEGFNEYG